MLLFKHLKVHSADIIGALRFEFETVRDEPSGNRLGF